MSDSPTTSRRHRLVALGLLLVLLGAAAAYQFRQQLLQELLRPLLAGELSRRLQVELTIGRLGFSDGRLQVEQLRIVSPGLGRVELDGLECQLDWSALRERRLTRLLLIRPRIVLPPADPAAGPVAIAWPQLPPWAVTDLEIRQGTLLFPGRAVPAWQFAGRGQLGKQWEFELRLQATGGNPQQLELRAHGSWDGAIRAELDRLAWQDHNLLTEPLRLTLQDGIPVELAGELQLAGLTHAELADLAATLGQSLPQLPPWRIEALRLRARLAEQVFHLESALDTLWIGDQLARPLLRQVALTAHGAAGGPISFDTDALFGPAGDPLVLAGQWLRADHPVMILNHISWRHQSLLVEPLQLSLAGPPTKVAPVLELAQLDGIALQSLLDLADLRLPATPQWRLRELRLKPSWDGRRLQLQVTAKSGILQAAGRQLSLERIQLAVNGRQEQWQLDGSAGFGASSTLQAGVQLREGRLQGRVTLELPDLAAFIQAQPKLGLPPLQGGLTLAGDLAGLAEQPSLTLSATVNSLSLDRPDSVPRLDLVATATALRRQANWRLNDGRWSASLSGQWTGKLNGGLSGRLDAGGWLLQLTDLHGEELTWTAQDGLSAYAGGRLTLDGSVSQATDAPLGFDVHGELSGGELLHGGYYASLAELSSRFALQGRIIADSLRLEQALLDIPRFGVLDMHGTLEGSGSRLEANLDLPDLRQTLADHGRTLFGEAFPQLDKLSLAGALRIRATATHGPDHWGLRLWLEPHQVALGWGEQLRIADLQGSLPLLFGTHKDPASLPGRLAWTRMSFGPLGSGPAELATLARPNELRLLDELRLEIAGGELRLTDTALVLPPDRFEITGLLSVSGVELQALTRALDWPEMRGDLSAELGRLYLRQGELGTSGTAEIDVFDGHISLTGLRLRELFSRYPEFHADIDFRGIDLYQLTNTFEFGEMNGVIDGHIHQLRLFGATPTRFEATLKTRPGGTRNISVKALNNLTILSQGGLSAALSRGIYQFIDFYRYRSLGIECSLENDLFRMRGTALEGSDRYLVYGGFLPPRIDIISSSPAVSFKEMVRRLKRIERPASGSSGD